MTTPKLGRMLRHARALRGPAAVLLTLIALAGSAAAQSTDRDNPTRLTSNVISGTMDVPQRTNYYYAFTAGPGEVRITLDVQSPRSSGTAVSVALLDMDARQIGDSSFGLNSINNEEVREVRRVQFNRRQPVILRVFVESGPGRYKVQLAGAVDLGQPAATTHPATPPPPPTFNAVLPTSGVLRVEMRDGTAQEIDLSRVRQVTVRP